MKAYSTPILVFITGILFWSCTNRDEREKQKLQNDMRAFFKTNLEDSTNIIDSFRLLKIDTVTQRMLLREQSSVLSKQLDILIEFFKLSNKELSSSVSQMQLYEMLNSRGLMEVEKREFDKKKGKSLVIRAEVDTLMSIINSIDSSAKSADTLKPIGFQARCFYQLRLKDKSVKRDTTFILLNINKDIVKRSDFLKLPYTVDFDKIR